MAPKSGKPNGGRRNAGQFTAVRMALATGATLAVLISAQMFASANAASTSTSTSSNATQAAVIAVATATPQTDDTELVSESSSDDLTSLLSAIVDSQSSSTATTPTTTVTSTQSQPSPRTHSSR